MNRDEMIRLNREMELHVRRAPKTKSTRSPIYKAWKEKLREISKQLHAAMEEREPKHADPLDQALNEGDGVYRP